MGEPKGLHITLKTWFKDFVMILRDHSQLNQKSNDLFFPLKTPCIHGNVPNFEVATIL